MMDANYSISDTEQLYTEATQKIFDRYGKLFDWSIKEKIMGCEAQQAAKYVIEMAQLPIDATEFNTELYILLESVFHKVKLMPGIFKLCLLR